jgi:hypothetical protein
MANLFPAAPLEAPRVRDVRPMASTLSDTFGLVTGRAGWRVKPSFVGSGSKSEAHLTVSSN